MIETLQWVAAFIFTVILLSFPFVFFGWFIYSWLTNTKTPWHMDYPFKRGPDENP